MKTPLELVQTLLSNPTNIDHVRGLTTGDVTYVSLNFDNPELHKVLPWTGTNRGPQRIVDVFNGIGRVWETKAFEIRDVVANEHSVAMFGSFTYKTRMLGKEITSPFALLAKVTGDKISYLQFLEDTFGTASTFRASGTWHFRASQPETTSASDLDRYKMVPGGHGRCASWAQPTRHRSHEADAGGRCPRTAYWR